MNDKPEYEIQRVMLLINSIGKLRVLYLPFRVRCIRESRGIPVGTWVYVDAVYADQMFRIAYLIQGSSHPYNNFQITITF